MEYKKHKFNIFPEMQAEDFERLKNDLKLNGFDSKQPIYIYDSEILDGWNRNKACTELEITPYFKDFTGSDLDAINFVMRTNKRRNLNSSQWACIAAEADDLINLIADQVEKEKIEKQKLNAANQYTKESALVQLIVPTQKDTTKLTDSKIASTFNTNRTYVSEATKLRENNPEIFEQVKSGLKTLTEVKKDENKVKLENKKQENLIIQAKEIEDKKPDIYHKDCKDFLNTIEDNSVDLLFTDPPYSTDVDNIKEFAESWVNLALSKVKENGRAFICIGAYPEEINTYLTILLKQNKFILDNPLIWTYRNTLGITPKMKYNLNYQIILHLYSEKSRELDTSITNEMFSVQDINAPDGRQANRYHTWQKPDELALRLIKHTTKEKDIIIDCFACTGTFILMAAKMNRIATGCDLSVDNLQIAKDRGANVIY